MNAVEKDALAFQRLAALSLLGEVRMRASGDQGRWSVEFHVHGTIYENDGQDMHAAIEAVCMRARRDIERWATASTSVSQKLRALL